MSSNKSGIDFLRTYWDGSSSNIWTGVRNQRFVTWFLNRLHYQMRRQEYTSLESFLFSCRIIAFFFDLENCLNVSLFHNKQNSTIHIRKRVLWGASVHMIVMKWVLLGRGRVVWRTWSMNTRMLSDIASTLRTTTEARNGFICRELEIERREWAYLIIISQFFTLFDVPQSFDDDVMNASHRPLLRHTVRCAGVIDESGVIAVVSKDSYLVRIMYLPSI